MAATPQYLIVITAHDRIFRFSFPLYEKNPLCKNHQQVN